MSVRIVGTRDRLDAFCRHASPSWVIRDRQHLETLATELRELMEDLRSELDKINGPDSYRTHTWFERFRPAKTNAQILYLLGDHHGARREIDGLVNQFANRVNANRADWWLEQLGLRALG